MWDNWEREKMRIAINIKQTYNDRQTYNVRQAYNIIQAYNVMLSGGEWFKIYLYIIIA